MKEFIERLQGLINEKEVTITEVAAGAGLDRPSLSQVLGGKRKSVRAATIRKLATFFDCDPNWLKTGEGERRRKTQGAAESCSTEGFDESLNVTFSQIRQWLLEERGGTVEVAMEFSDELQDAIKEFKAWKITTRIIKNPEKRGLEPVNV